MVRWRYPLAGAAVLALLVVSGWLLLPGGDKAAADCSVSTPAFEHMGSRTLTLINDRGETVHLDARIADDGAERAAGFQYLCPAVIERTNILFIFVPPIASGFHMRNVHAPLDIAFIAPDGRVSATARMLPGKERYGPPGVIGYALETRVGVLEELGVSAAGSRLLPETQ
jgi:uncharacterized membrane protein (UPF0127 family)